MVCVKMFFRVLLLKMLQNIFKYERNIPKIVKPLRFSLIALKMLGLNVIDPDWHWKHNVLQLSVGFLCLSSSLIEYTNLMYRSSQDIVKFTEMTVYTAFFLSSIVKIGIIIVNKDLLRSQISLLSSKFVPFKVSLKMKDKFDSDMRKFLFTQTFYYFTSAIVIASFEVIYIIDLYRDNNGIGNLIPNFPHSYDLGFVLTGMGNLYCMAGYIGIDCLFLYFILLACFQFDFLTESLQHLHQNVPASQVDKMLRDFLKNHVILLRFIENIRQCFELIASVQIIQLGIKLCIFFFFIKEGALPHFKIAFLPIVIQFVIYCAFGQEIMTKSANLRSSLWNCNWRDWTISQRKTLTIMLIASSKDVSIRAKGLAVLSLDTMTKISRKSYESTAVLRSLK